MINIDDLTIGQIREIAQMTKCSSTVGYETFLEVGKCYLIRTVTNYHVGRLVGVNRNELLLANASWVADTRRFHNTLKNGFPNDAELEPFINPVIVNRGGIIDVTEWTHPLPKEQQ